MPDLADQRQGGGAAVWKLTTWSPGCGVVAAVQILIGDLWSRSP